MRFQVVFISILTVLVAACGATQKEASKDSPASGPAAVPLFDNFGALHHDIATRVPAAQQYFDQGLRMTYGFNHEAAGRSFAEAARLDPDCAMCVWGQALVLGPNINLPMDPEHAKDATELAARAASLAANATEVDKALIHALQKRYAFPAPEDRAELDRAYADAMAAVVEQFPENDEAATLYAEALMDLSPWAYWEKDGAPAQFTERLLGELEGVLERNPKHIGAIHYFIHATEASPNPERAVAYADALAELAPGSGHLVHMPAHTYIRVGRYHDATLTNLSATTADKTFLAVCRGSNGVYPLGYVPHNWHFATMTASLTGSREMALLAAWQTEQRADKDAMGSAPLEFMQQYTVAPVLTQVRFGDWDAILSGDQSSSDLPYVKAIRHFARGMAQLRKGAFDEATLEAKALDALVVDPAMAELSFFGINHANQVLKVAAAMLGGELLRSQGKHSEAIARLREAAMEEDALAYNEPADWPLPVRPYLGAALLEAGDARAAADAFAEDLKNYPLNGWSLFGLAQAQGKLGLTEQAAETSRQFESAWQWADVKLTASRF